MCSNFRSYLQIKFSSQSCGFNWKYWCPAFLSFQHLSFLIYKTENKTYSWLELFNLDNFCQEFLTYFCFTRTRSCRFKNSFPISDIENASYWMKQFKMLSGSISRYLEGIQLFSVLSPRHGAAVSRPLCTRAGSRAWRSPSSGRCSVARTSSHAPL